MQQQNDTGLPTAQDPLIAQRLAEFNATNNHFLGAIQRPWMTNAASISTLPAEGEVLQLRPSRDTTVTNNTSGPAASESVQYTTGAQPHCTERSRSVGNHGTSATAEPSPASHWRNGTTRKRSLDVVEPEVDARRPSTSQRIQQPGSNSLSPSSEPARPAQQIPGALLPSAQPSIAHQVQIITIPAMNSLSSFKAGIGTLSTIEDWRLSLLKEACAQSDLFYLCVHQILCAAFIGPRQIVQTGYGEPQFAGLKFLSLPLLPNKDLSVRVLKFFADFPSPLEILIKDSTIYRSAIRQVGAFLQLFAERWDMLKNSFVRAAPPSVHELIHAFKLHSSVLQRVLFNFIHRQLGGTGDVTWGKQGLNMFDVNQAQYRARWMNRGNGEVRPQSEILAEKRFLAALRYNALREESNALTARNGPAEHMVASPQPSPSQLSIPQDQDASGTLPARSASASQSYIPSSPQYHNHMLWPPAHDPLSRSQSTTALQINTQFANDGTTRAFSASGTQPLPSPMNPPRFVLESSPRGVENSLTYLSGHQGQPPPPQRRQGCSPSSNRPVVPRISTSAAQRCRGGSRGGQGGHVNSHSPANQLIANPTTQIPAFGHDPVQTSNPNPNITALHQAYLRSPSAEKLNAVGQRVADIKLYQYLQAFALPPTAMDQASTFVCWEFLATASEISKKAVDVMVSGGRMRRFITNGCILYRLRSIEVAHSCHTIEASEWSVKEMSWPPSCFVRINDVDIELRRKCHHGKDLPIDLTKHVREGKNKLTIALLGSREDKASKRHAMAVEISEVGDQARVDSAPTVLAAAESLQWITQGLATADSKTTDDEDEVQAVDSHISIDLIDPFMATIFVVPARGKSCSHRECFDLQTYYQTRKSQTKDGPTSPDEWKCPICKKDARPQSLIVDGFLQTVRDSLVASGAAADARAILVGSDGSWSVKRDVADTSRTREGPNATVAGSPATGNVSSMVIEIEDD